MWKDPRLHFDTSAYAVIFPLQISSAGFMSSAVYDSVGVVNAVFRPVFGKTG
jgi:hypothetical protein